MNQVRVGFISGEEGFCSATVYPGLKKHPRFFPRGLQVCLTPTEPPTIYIYLWLQDVFLR